MLTVGSFRTQRLETMLFGQCKLEFVQTEYLDVVASLSNNKFEASFKDPKTVRTQCKPKRNPLNNQPTLTHPLIKQGNPTKYRLHQENNCPNTKGNTMRSYDSLILG